jgi:hypothetical protein
MRCARTNFVIAAGTAIDLDGTRRGDRAYFVLIAVGPGFYTAVHRRQ